MDENDLEISYFVGGWHDGCFFGFFTGEGRFIKTVIYKQEGSPYSHWNVRYPEQVAPFSSRTSTEVRALAGVSFAPFPRYDKSVNPEVFAC
jgi:hypothetical protein